MGYRFDWHTGCRNFTGPNCEKRVDFFVDDVYIGTNNVFVPTRSSRLVIALRPSSTQKSIPDGYTWNNWPDYWGHQEDGVSTGAPGDSRMYLQHAFVSEIKITPFNEPNDVTYPS